MANEQDKCMKKKQQQRHVWEALKALVGYKD